MKPQDNRLTRGLVQIATRMRIEGRSQQGLGNANIGLWLLMEADAIDRVRCAILERIRSMDSDRG